MSEVSPTAEFTLWINPTIGRCVDGEGGGGGGGWGIKIFEYKGRSTFVVIILPTVVTCQYILSEESELITAELFYLSFCLWLMSAT